mgnify:CR=1 FL=1
MGVRVRKEIKGIQTGKVKLSLFVCRGRDTQNAKDATRKLLELINDFGEIAGYEVNTQKSLAFLYTNNEKIC